MLGGLRVVELSTEPGAALTGRLLAMYGAEVIAVEPPGGHPTRHRPPWKAESADASILFAYLGAGKKSIAGDLSDPGFREVVRGLIWRADVLLESHAPGDLAALGLDPARLIEEHPRLVVCSVTPFGQTGPRARWRMTALTAAASGGQMGLCGDPDKPPLKAAGYQAYYQAGLHAFSACLAAVHAARRDGLGDWIDLSIQEVQASTLEGSGPGALMNGTEAGRNAGNRTFAQWGIQPCKDGYIGLAAMPRQSYDVYDCIGHPELKDDPAFGSGWSPDANALLSVLIPEWTMQHTAAEIFDIAARYRAPFAMIPGPRELLEWPGLREVGFWREVDHPVLGRHPLPSGPIILGDGTRGTAERAPLLDEHGAELIAELRDDRASSASAGVNRALARLPFDGIRVVDVTQVWAGPYGTRFLADLGAEVVKIEGPSFADPIRTMGGARQVPEVNQSAYFNEYNRNKLGISLDIKQAQGMEALKRLIASADVFIENWSSGVAERIGLGYDDVRSLNPSIVYVSMPGFGHVGQDATRVGFGPTIEQMGGLVALQGYEGGEPHRSGISYGDPVAGTVAAGAVAMALLRRQATGEGSSLVVAQRDIICGLVAEYVLAEAVGTPLPTRIGNTDPQYAPHGVYRAADTEPRPIRSAQGQPAGFYTDQWLAIAVDGDEAWEGLKRVVAAPELEDPAFATVDGRRVGRETIDRVLEAWAAPLDATSAATALQAEGVPACPVLTPLLVSRDDQMGARRALLPYEHPSTGAGRTTRPVWRMERRPATTVRPAPRFGEHSREVLRRLAGYSDAEIDGFEARQVVTEDLIPGVAG